MKGVVRRRAWLFLGCLLTGVLAWAQAEDLARRHFQSAQRFFERGDYEQALRDWQTVVERFPDSPYAPEALVAIGRHWLERRSDPDRAFEAFRQVLQRYPTAPAAAAAAYFAGHIRLRYGQGSTAEVSEALADLERVAVLYPDSEWAGRALTDMGLYLGAVGQTARARHLCRRALEHFGRPPAEAALCIARAYAWEARWNEALNVLASLRVAGIPDPLVQKIRAAATTLYRQAFRGSTPGDLYALDPNFQVSQQIRWDDPVRILEWSRGWALVDRGLKWVLFYDTAGRYVDRQTFSKLEDAFITADDRLYALAGDRVVLPSGRPVVLSGTTEGRKGLSLEPAALVVDRRRTLWAYADNASGLWAFEMASEEGRNPTPVGASLTAARRLELSLDGKPLRVSRFYVDEWGRFWVIDRDQTQVLTYAPDGTLVRRIVGTPRPFQRVIALGWDACGLTYVLDAKAQQVWVFTPAGQPHRAVDVRPFLPGARLQDMGVAADGSLYLLDRKARRVVRLI